MLNSSFMDYKNESAALKTIRYPENQLSKPLIIEGPGDIDQIELDDSINNCISYPSEESWYKLCNILDQGLSILLTEEQFAKIADNLAKYYKNQPIRSILTLRVFQICIKKFQQSLHPLLVDFFLNDLISLFKRETPIPQMIELFQTLYYLIPLSTDEQLRKLSFDLKNFYFEICLSESFPFSNFIGCLHSIIEHCNNVFDTFLDLSNIIENLTVRKDWGLSFDCIGIFITLIQKDPKICTYLVEETHIFELLDSLFCRKNDCLNWKIVKIYYLLFKELNLIPTNDLFMKIFNFLPTENFRLETSVINFLILAVTFSDEYLHFLSQENLFLRIKNFGNLKFSQKVAIMRFARTVLEKSPSLFLNQITDDIVNIAVDAIESSNAKMAGNGIFVLFLLAKEGKFDLNEIDFSTAEQIEDVNVHRLIDLVIKTRENVNE
ncbi:hypothetical protein TRFO_06323 [Tritrichomonas foetus]|uniref:SPIN90/Ldb17 leucine-rich domain-containing protein n=1 Tax=Tritrichomonas foetus TaxID=1144522 RepID=A0A1J4JZ31_9EUKA|nr:hypothetical protein TRFO_06323 [Tritrichomonas foetus]|eukprot:OHT04431.1 hypothetical protein TRFO_06323 [Tritrichomonas foetus]